MTVDDDDLRCLGLADAIVAAQAQHVLGVAMTAAVARNGLDSEERKPSFPAQPLDDLDGGYMDIAVRPTVMCLVRED